MNKNQKMLAYIGLFVLFMIGMSFAAVPAYRLFCQVTGFDGTPNIFAEKPDVGDARDRTIPVRFTSSVDPGFPWDFEPLVKRVRAQVGVSNLVGFEAENESDQVTVGTAVYNVVPQKTARYFNKTMCFCFERQSLAPGQKANFPIEFHIDPAFYDDPEMADVGSITLNYVFYPAGSEALERAIEQGYNPIIQ